MNLLTIFTLLFPFFPLLAESGNAPATAAPDLYNAKEGNLSPSYSSANAAAMHFINLIDNQAYGGAWGDCAALMRDIVSKKVWVAGMGALRTKLGLVKARRVTSHQSLKSLPGGTKGEFMVIHYSTEFANHPTTVETVTLMLQAPYGQWKVISYNIGNQ